MAKAKGGYLGWIVVAGAFIAWLSVGHEEKIVVSPLPVSTSLPTFSSTQNAVRSAPQVTTTEEPAPALEVPAKPESSFPAAPQANVQTNGPTSGRPMSTMINLFLRSSEAADSPIIATLNKGTAVEVVGSAGDQFQVKAPSLNVTGWVHKNYLIETSLVARPAPALGVTDQTPPKPASSVPMLTPRHSKPATGTPIRDPG